MPDDEDEHCEKPSHWEDEHQLRGDAGQPASPDVGAPASLAWERFAQPADTQ